MSTKSVDNEIDPVDNSGTMQIDPIKPRNFVAKNSGINKAGKILSKKDKERNRRPKHPHRGEANDH